MEKDNLNSGLNGEQNVSENITPSNVGQQNVVPNNNYNPNVVNNTAVSSSYGDLDNSKGGKGAKGIIIAILLVIIVAAILFCLNKFNKDEKYTIKFDTNGGTNISEQIVNKDSKIKKPNMPKKDGYNFLGWFVGNKEYDFNSTVTSDITLEAKWEKVEDVKVTDVSLDQSEVTIKVGATLQLNAIITPDDAKEKGVTWSSSDDSIATVDENGNITAKKKGTATIKVVTKDGNHEATCKVTVSTDVVKVKGISLDKTTASVGINNTITLKATVKPADASNKGVTWSSSDKSIATVENGKVKGLKEGKVTITAETKDGGYKATATITVKTIKVTGVSLNTVSKTIAVGQTYTLKATVKPADASNKGVKWSSSDTSIVTVDGGKIKGIKEGTATVTVTTKDGNHKATATITVKPAQVTKVTISGKSSVTVGKTITLSASVSTIGNADKTVKWESSDTSIATVSSKGVVKGIKPGTVTIKATAGGKTATKKITVVAAKMSLTISIKALCAEGNSTIQGYSFVVKNNGREYTDYKAIKVDGITVKKGGKISPSVAPGEYTITIVTNNNGEQKIKGILPKTC